MTPPPRLVVGLGNPGERYAPTRHNVGFRVLDRLARREGLIFEPGPSLLPRAALRGSGDFVAARLGEPGALLVKPLTFMNRSGEVVAPLVRWTLGAGDEEPLEADRAPGHLLVVYDDLDLAPGALRLRPHGGTGGQKGMRSIVDLLGTDRFPRLRVGVGRPATDAARHVLSPFSPEEEPLVEEAVAEACDALLDWLATGDIERCMTRFHSRWNERLRAHRGPADRPDQRSEES